MGRRKCPARFLILKKIATKAQGELLHQNRMHTGCCHMKLLELVVFELLPMLSCSEGILGQGTTPNLFLEKSMRTSALVR